MTGRTLSQNKAIHLYCKLLAKKFNASGLDMKTVLKPSVEIPWSQDTVKDQLFKVVMNAMFPEIESTKDLNTSQVSEVYETLNRHTATKLGVSLAFPNREEMK